MKKILFLTRNFPPLVTSGSSRAWKLALHMPEFGWEPIVIAPHDITGLDDEHPAGQPAVVPKMTVHRTGKPLNAAVLDSSGKSSLARGKPVASMQSVKSRISGIFTNDPEGVEWDKIAAQLIEQLMKDHPDIEMIYAQGPPLNPLLLALDVARKHHLTLILDIIDPVDHAVIEPGGMSSMQTNMARIEERILMSGVTIITPTRVLKEYFLKKYQGRLAHDDITIVHHGYDGEALVCRPSGNQKSPVMRWAFYLERVLKSDLKIIVKGLEAFAAGEGYVPGAAEFIFFGEAARDIVRYVKKTKLASLIDVRDCSTVCQEIEICRTADVFCSVLGKDALNSVYMPERLIDVLGLNKPLFAIAPEGAARQLVREANGLSALVTNPEEITEQCRIMAGLWKSSGLPVTPEPVRQKYEIRQSLHELTREIARLLPL